MRYESIPVMPERNYIQKSYDGFKAILKEKGIEILLSAENVFTGQPDGLNTQVKYCRSLYCTKRKDSICCKTCSEYQQCDNACDNDPKVCGLQSRFRTFDKTRGVRGV